MLSIWLLNSEICNSWYFTFEWKLHKSEMVLLYLISKAHSISMCFLGYLKYSEVRFCEYSDSNICYLMILIEKQALSWSPSPFADIHHQTGCNILQQEKDSRFFSQKIKHASLCNFFFFRYLTQSFSKGTILQIVVFGDCSSVAFIR